VIMPERREIEELAQRLFPALSEGLPEAAGEARADAYLAIYRAACARHGQARIDGWRADESQLEECRLRAARGEREALWAGTADGVMFVVLEVTELLDRAKLQRAPR